MVVGAHTAGSEVGGHVIRAIGYVAAASKNVTNEADDPAIDAARVQAVKAALAEVFTSLRTRPGMAG